MGNLVRVALIAVREESKCVLYTLRYTISLRRYLIIKTSQCDQLQPVCSQCLRIGKSCSGPRDQLALMFRDESKDVVRKALTRKGSPLQSPPVQNHLQKPKDILDREFTIDHTSTFQYRTQDSVEANPYTTSEGSIEEQGIRFLMEHYISINPKGNEQNLFMLRANPLSYLANSKMTYDARACIGLAGLANVRNDRSIMELARSKYASALHLTIEALQDPVKVKQNGTLGAVVMLAMFEVIIFLVGPPSTMTLMRSQIIVCDIHSKKKWAGHITGAAALLKERGLQGFEHRDHSRTFVQLCYGIVSSLSASKQLPCLMRSKAHKLSPKR